MSKNAIKFTIGATGVDKATSDVKKFQQTTTREMTQAEKSVASSIGKMISQYASLAVAINKVKKAITTGIDFNQFKESQETAFTVMMKSADKAKAKIEELRKFAITNPITFKETVGSSKQLLAYGFDADELVPTIERLGTVALATGNKLDDVAYVFGTLRAQGRAYSRDLMQFGTRGIPIYEELSKVLGVSVNQVQKLTSQGKVGFKEVEKAFINMTSVGGRFDGLLNKFMDTAKGKALQLGGMWETALGDATKGLAEQIKRLLDSLTDFVQTEQFDDMIRSLEKSLTKIGTVVVDTLLALVTHLPVILKLLKAIVMLNIGKLIYKGVASVPKLIVLISEKLFAMTSAANVGVLSVNSLTFAFGELGAAVQLALGAALPIVGAIAGVGAVVGGGLAIQHGISKHKADARRNSDNEQERLNQLVQDYGNKWQRANGSVWEMMKALVGLEKQMRILNSIDITRIAERYGLSEEQVISNLGHVGISTDVYKAKEDEALEARVKAANAKMNANAGLWLSTLESIGMTTEEHIVSVLPEMLKKKFGDAVLTGKGVKESTLYDTLKEVMFPDALTRKNASFSIDDIAKAFLEGNKEVQAKLYEALSLMSEPSLQYKKDYILSLLEKADKNLMDMYAKDKVPQAEIDDKLEAIYTANLDTLKTTYNNLVARDVEEIRKAEAEALSKGVEFDISKVDQNPLLRAWLVEQIKEHEDLLSGLGSKAKELLPTFKELDKWWLPDEARVAATVDAFDDIELVYEKALYNAEAEIDARRKIIKENLAIAQTEADKLHWAQQLRDIDKQREEIMENITKEAERQRDASKFNVLLSGNSEYFKDKQAKAFKAYEGMTVSGGVPVSEKIAGIYDAYKDDSPMQMLVHGIRDFYNNIESFDIKGSFKEMWDSGLKEGVTEQAKSHLEGTEVGSIMSTQGLGFIPQMVAAFMEMLMSIENVNKVLNPFATIFESMKNIIEPFVNSALKPIVNILEMIGEMLGKVLAPIISGIQIVMSALYVALLPLNIIISVVGEAFAWFNDHVMYPIGNALIDTINGVIKALNKIPGVNIKYIDRINKVSDAMDNLVSAAQNVQSSLSSTINYLTKKLNALVDKQVESARSLYEVGAITGAEYEAQIAEMNRGRLETDLLMISKADQQIEDAQGMLSRLYELALLDATIANNQLTDEQVTTLLKDAGLVTESQETMFAKAARTALDGYGGATAKGIETGINKIIASIPDAKIPETGGGSSGGGSSGGGSSGGGWDWNLWSLMPQSVQDWGDQVDKAVATGLNNAVSWVGKLIGLDVGTPFIPYDQLAMVHKGEGIVPATFMEAIRSGELSLSGRGAGSGVTVVVNVEGSVQAENDLADTIAEAIYTRRSRGLVTV